MGRIHAISHDGTILTDVAVCCHLHLYSNYFLLIYFFVNFIYLAHDLILTSLLNLSNVYNKLIVIILKFLVLSPL